MADVSHFSECGKTYFSPEEKHNTSFWYQSNWPWRVSSHGGTAFTHACCYAPADPDQLIRARAKSKHRICLPRGRTRGRHGPALAYQQRYPGTSIPHISQNTRRWRSNEWMKLPLTLRISTAGEDGNRFAPMLSEGNKFAFSSRDVSHALLLWGSLLGKALSFYIGPLFAGFGPPDMAGWLHVWEADGAEGAIQPLTERDLPRNSRTLFRLSSARKTSNVSYYHTPFLKIVFFP